MKLVSALEQWTWLQPLIERVRRVWRWSFALRCAWNEYFMIRGRADRVCASPDFERIPRVPNAGRVRGGVQIMHNGLKVLKGSYYGRGSISLFRRTRGVHEPQEEIAFGAVLPYLPSGATMVELGSYWAFYSIWFARAVPNAHCHLVEPEPANLELGRRNFELNGLMPQSSTRAFVGATAGSMGESTPVVTLEQLVRDLGIGHVHLLHADIQASELDMLEGARGLIAADRIDFIFISTHGGTLHDACREFLHDQQFDVLLDVSPTQSYSIDGVLVAQRRGVRGPGPISVALRQSQSDAR